MAAFEFDPAKSRANRDKHGIDFAEAQSLWKGQVVKILSNYPGESRSLVIGLLGGKYWTAIVTDRKSVVRIISVRRSRTEEIERYERRNPDQ